MANITLKTFTLAVLLALQQNVVAETASITNEPETVEVNGATVEFVEQGSGPLLILAHGSVLDYQRWVKDHMPLFAPNFHVVSYSMRYHGNIPWEDNWPPLTLDLYADDLAGFIDSFGVGPAHLVGWSMGAQVVHTTALKYPELVRSAYLFEGVADIARSAEAAQEIQKVASELYNPIFEAYEKNDQIGAVRALVDGVGGQIGIFDGLPEPVQSYVASKSNALRKYLQRAKHEPTPYECEDVRNSRVPTTLVVGTSSVEYFQTVLVKHTFHCFGERRITLIEDAGHLWPGNAVDFVTSVSEFALKH